MLQQLKLHNTKLSVVCVHECVFQLTDK